MHYILPLGVEHGDLRELHLLSDESLVLRCKTPSVRSSETCLVLATHLPLVCLRPNLRNRIPPDFVSSKILWENVLVSLSGCLLPSFVFSTLEISHLAYILCSLTIQVSHPPLRNLSFDLADNMKNPLRNLFNVLSNPLCPPRSL